MHPRFALFLMTFPCLAVVLADPPPPLRVNIVLGCAACFAFVVGAVIPIRGFLRRVDDLGSAGEGDSQLALGAGATDSTPEAEQAGSAAMPGLTCLDIIDISTQVGRACRETLCAILRVPSEMVDHDASPPIIGREGSPVSNSPAGGCVVPGGEPEAGIPEAQITRFQPTPRKLTASSVNAQLRYFTGDPPRGSVEGGGRARRSMTVEESIAISKLFGPSAPDAERITPAPEAHGGEPEAGSPEARITRFSRLTGAEPPKAIDARNKYFDGAPSISMIEGWDRGFDPHWPIDLRDLRAQSDLSWEVAPGYYGKGYSTRAAPPDVTGPAVSASESERISRELEGVHAEKRPPELVVEYWDGKFAPPAYAAVLRSKYGMIEVDPIGVQVVDASPVGFRWREVPFSDPICGEWRVLVKKPGARDA